MATGYLDANGVWQHGEDDPLSPFSSFMHLLEAPLSTTLGLLDGRVEVLEDDATRRNSVAGTTNASGDITVSFSTPMPSSSYVVLITDINVGAGIGPIPWKVHSKTTTTFKARAMNGTTPIPTLATTFDYVTLPVRRR